MDSHICMLSCDTFVVLPPCTKGGIIFGKNSDRPAGEVQEVIYQEAKDYPDNTNLQCTYISIDQVKHTYAVILSKPAWMWGAEMGANEYGLCIGNEAVFSDNFSCNEDKALLGMDLLRLGLERAKTADEALKVITNLLETFGQGGCCAEVSEFYYHNSFLIADPNSAWIIETVGCHWVAQHITNGYQNISNCYSIEDNITKISNDIKACCKSRGYWDGSSSFSFKEAVADSGDDSRKRNGEKLLEKYCAANDFSLKDMFAILRDKDSGICRSVGSSYPSMGSMVSVLAPPDSGKPCCHWFTGTPDPELSVYKPFIFTPNAKISPYIQSPLISDDEAKKDHSHLLYRKHQSASYGKENIATLKEVEKKCIEEVESFLENYQDDRLSEVDDLFKDCVDSELKFYK